MKIIPHIILKETILIEGTKQKDTIIHRILFMLTCNVEYLSFHYI